MIGHDAQELMEDLEKMHVSESFTKRLAKWRRGMDATIERMQHDALSLSARLIVDVYQERSANESSSGASPTMGLYFCLHTDARYH